VRLAIMQPYLFPYLGYFQLIRAVDAFVLYDDVNYIKGGWINRNYILGQEGKQRLTVPLLARSSNRLINEIEIGPQTGKLIKAIQQCYSKAPGFAATFPLIEDIFLQPEKNLARFLCYSLKTICTYLALQPKWYISSELQKDNGMRGQYKVLAINKILGATHYINLPGGAALYSKEIFNSEGIQLSFVKPASVAYPQFGKTFIPNLSIIDTLMFSGVEGTKLLLDQFSIEGAKE
jgi:hypothetical protein